jgi:hypothetical protein
MTTPRPSRRDPVIIDPGTIVAESTARYRFKPLPARVAVTQLERLVVDFGSDFITRVNTLVEESIWESARTHRERVDVWVASGRVGPEPTAPPIRPDLLSSFVSIAEYVQSTLTGDTLVRLQVAHFLACEASIEVDGQWVRLVAPPEGDATEPNCEGLDYDVPLEDVMPLWWHLLLENIGPLLRPIVTSVKALLPMGNGSSTPSTPATDSTTPDSSEASRNPASD